jgi:hypothetical protein
MTDWKRRVAVIGVLAVSAFSTAVILEWLFAPVLESYWEGIRDDWGEYLPVSDWQPRQYVIAILVPIIGWPHGLLSLPARIAVTWTGKGDQLDAWSAEWLLLLTASSLLWALVLYGIWSGIQAARRRRLGT